MRRTIRVTPDEVRTTIYGDQVAVVSDAKRSEALQRADIVVDFIGGTVSALYGRISSGVDGEMWTSEMLVTVQDRADAKQQYEEPVSFESRDGLTLVHVGEPEPPPQDDPDFEPEPDPELIEA